MFLKTLEIQGFKSFPEKVCLEFNKGITAVVGPNGSGKSNISDAVRWVLGEQSAKSLRGGKMEDIIFAGTANRRALSFTEVSLIMDNSSGKIGTDYSEVSVTRRVYRSGESEYLINGTTCRMKDIHELFMDTGIGKDGYSIIGQGKIDEILSTRSEDRRKLFEEAAGIIKFKNRRGEAELKLEKERQSLVRVNDIINEIEIQLEPLKLHSEKALAYVKLMDKLKLIHINLFLSNVESFQKELDTLTENISIAENQIQEETQLIQKYRNRYDIEKQSLHELEKNIDAYNHGLLKKGENIRDSEHKIKMIEQSTEHLKSDVKRIASDIEQKELLIQNKIQDKDLYHTKNNSLQLEVVRLQNDIREHQLVFEKLDSKLSENEHLIEKYNADMLKNVHQISEISNYLDKATFICDQLQNRKSELQKEIDYCNSQQHDKIVGIRALNFQRDNIQYSIRSLNSNLQEVRNTDQFIQEEINKLNNNERSYAKQLSEKSSEYKVLSTLKDSYEGYFKSVKTVLKKNFSGICGAVGELISVPEKYELAAQVALGQTVQNIVTEDEKSAQHAIEYLKHTKSGRATFLPLSSIQPREPVNDNILREKGVIGTLKNLLNYDERFKNIASSLAERVIIIDTLENATHFARKYSFAYKLVTVDGEVFHIGGSLTGGSVSRESNNIFGRERELKSLQSEIKDITDIHSNVKEMLSQKYNVKEENNKKVISLQSELQEKSQHIERINIQIEQQTNILSELDKKNQAMVLEDKSIADQIRNKSTEIHEFKAKKSTYEIEEIKIKEILEEQQRSIREDKETKDNKLRTLTKLRIALAEIDQQTQSNRDHITRISVDIQDLKSAVEKHKSDIEISESSIQDNSHQIELAKQQISDMKINIETMRQDLISLTEKKSTNYAQISQIEQDLEKKSMSLSNIKTDLVKMESKRDQLQDGNHKLYDYMWEEYEITYQAAKQYPKIDMSTEAMQKDEKSIKNEIKSMGYVNLSAIEEYKQVQERHQFLTTQRNDIVNAEEKLLKIIEELTKCMENQFMHHFKLISENFNHVFAEMFGGGQAHLILSEDNNILESGIEIAAEPPGKTLKNMLLLSGGERALTAIALLFAILKLKPSPFCILDEIEASLDDSNVVRFANYLKNFSNSTQFILITHRKGTMEAADAIYGVTMQDQGVSKLVSVNFS